MAKWTRLWSVLAPADAAIQAYRHGNMPQAESQLKRLNEGIDAMVKMAQLKQQIDMAPGELSYKKALEKQAYGAGELSLSAAEQNRAEIAQQAKIQEALVKAANELAPQLNVSPDVLLSKLDVGKIAKDIGSLYQTKADIEGNLYQAKTGADVSKFGEEKSASDYAKSINEQRVSQGLAPIQVGAESVGYQVKRDYGLQVGKGEADTATGKGMYDIEKGRRAPEIISAEIQADRNRGFGLGQDPSYYFTGLSRENSIETNIRGYTAMLTNLDSSDERTSNDALQSAMNVLGMGGAVTDANKERLKSQARDRLMQKIKDLESEKAFVHEVSGNLSGIREPIPETPRGIPIGGTVKYSKAIWDKLPYEKQKVLSDRHKIVDDKSGNPLPLKPKPTTQQEAKPAKPAETGNKIVEKTISPKAKQYVDSFKKKGIKSIDQLPPQVKADLKTLGLYDEVAQGLGGK